MMMVMTVIFVVLPSCDTLGCLEVETRTWKMARVMAFSRLVFVLQQVVQCVQSESLSLNTRLPH